MTVSFARLAWEMKCLSLGLLCMVFAIEANAKPQVPDVEQLIRTHQWREASRHLFIEARNASKFGPRAVVKAQANAEFWSDALETVEYVEPYGKAHMLWTIATASKSIPATKRQKLLQDALIHARNASGKLQHFTRSDPLTRISMAYLALGLEAQARAIFEEAMLAAAKDLNVEGSGGYRNITGALLHSKEIPIPDWMLGSLAKAAGSEDDAFGRLLTYSDIALLYSRMKMQTDAQHFLNLGFQTAKVVNRNRDNAIERLVRTAVEIGDTEAAKSGKFPSVMGLIAARSGDFRGAYALISRLPGGNASLYVDYRGEAYLKIIRDALHRSDLATAVYFAEHPFDRLVGSSIVIWTSIAELQIKNGDTKSARKSYETAAAVLGTKDTWDYYLDEVAATLRLGESMISNGMEDEGERMICTAMRQVATIPQRRLDDRIRANATVAKSLWRIRAYPQSTSLFLSAYQLARSYDMSKLHADQHKPEVLVEIGKAVGDLPEGASTPGARKSKSRSAQVQCRPYGA